MSNQRAAFLALGIALLALGVGTLDLLQRPSSPGSLQITLPETTRTAPADGQFKAYITGAVQQPGVYTVRAGDRVADLVELAGGPTEDADLSAVNFARRVRDEDQVLVPRKGMPATPAIAGATTAGNGRVDINTAPAAVLETLPGIGPARAQRIAESRVKDGPFSTTADLVKRKLVPQSVYDSIRDLIDVQPS
jgi:competence protein ComEA